MGTTSKMLVYAVSACALVTAGSAMPSAPGQTKYPGQMTQARVWVENRARTESIPTSLQDISPDALLKVQVAGLPPVAIDRSTIVQTRLVRQSWEYKSVTIGIDQNLGRELLSAGEDGWEATAMIPHPGSFVVLLKRPRP